MATPIDFLFSRAKWGKVHLLLREKRRELRYWITQRLKLAPGEECRHTERLPEATLSVDAEARGLEPVRLSEATLSVDVKATGKQPVSGIAKEQHDWTYVASVPVCAEVLSKAAITYHQDFHSGDGQVHAKFTYRVAMLPDARVVSNGVTHVSVYGSDDTAIPDFSYVKYRRREGRVANTTRKVAIDRFIPGLTVNLYGNVENAAGNYGHWLVDGIGMLHLVLREYSLDQIDHFLVPVMRYGFQKEALLGIGIPSEKIIEIPVLACYQFEQLICASAPRGHSSCITPGWLIDGYRNVLLPADISPVGKRLYISRRDAGSRKFVNEDEIIELLERHDFEAVEMSTYNFSEKVALFAHADIIIGLTGAGMTNMMFCSPNAHVIELFPTSYVTYFYASMAGYLGLDYRPLIFDNHSVLSSMNKYYGNLSLDPALLRHALQDLV